MSMVPSMKRRIYPTLALLFTTTLTACGGGGGGGASALPSAGTQTPFVVVSQVGTTLTVNGQITSLFSGGMYLQGGSGMGYLKVFVPSSATITGPAPFVGEQVQVTGTGSVSTSLTASSVSQIGASPAPSAAPLSTPGPTLGTPAPTITSGPAISLPSGVVAVGGPITAIFSGGFTIKGMPSYGYMHIYTNSGTTFANGAPAVGQYAYVSGTGKLGYSVTATYVSQYPSAPANVTVSGTVSAQTAYGFSLQTAAGLLPVSLTSTTVVGGALLTVGSQVSVTGTGSANTGVVAIQVVVSAPTPPPALATPTPGPIAMHHVLSGDYLGGYYGTRSVAWSTAAAYLTWAQTNLSDAPSIAAAGIKTQDYIDPNRLAGSGDPMWPAATSNEGAFAHACDGTRVTYTNAAYGTTYQMDPSNSGYQNSFHDWTAYQLQQAHFDAMFEDNAGPLSDLTADGTFSPGMPCNYSDAVWISAGEALNDASAAPVIINGIQGNSTTTLSQTLNLLASTNTIGGNFEHCYSDNNTPKAYGNLWTVTENTELNVVGRQKMFECMLRNTNAGSSNVDARLYAYASFLLTYDPQTSVYWEEFGTASGLHVFPEEQLVALNPVVGTPSSVSSLQVQGGAYGREYAQCYIGGSFVGSCAVAVNPDQNFAKPFPYPQYTHTLILSGGGVVDGGTIATNGSAPPTYLQPEQAVIAFP